MDFRKIAGFCATLFFCGCGRDLDFPVPPEPVSHLPALTASMTPEIAALAFSRWNSLVKPILNFRDLVDRINATNGKFEQTETVDREFSLRNWGLSGSAHLEFHLPCTNGSVSFNLLYFENTLNPTIWGDFESCPTAETQGKWAFSTQLIDSKTLDLNQIAASITFLEKDAQSDFFFKIEGDIVKAPLLGEFGAVEVTYYSENNFEISATDDIWRCDSGTRVCQNDAQAEITW